MTPDELRPVWEAYWAPRPGDEETEAAREAAHDILVRAFLPIAAYHARQALAKAPAHQDPDDIYSYAHRGLLDAINRFRPDRGAQFETYASRRIPYAIIDGQRNDDPLSRKGRRRVKTVTLAAEQLRAAEGHEPSVAEIAAYAGLSESEVRDAWIEQQSMNASLDLLAEAQADDAQIVTDDGTELAGQLAEVTGTVAQRLAQMPGMERAFTLLYYVDNLSMAEAQVQLDIGSDWCGRTKQNVLTAIQGR